MGGLTWITFGTIANGILYELFARAKETPALLKCFWSMSGMAVFGLVLSAGASWSAAADPKTLALLAGFAFVGGFLYWLANLLAFENLPTAEASVLAQGETPAVIIGAGLLLGERLTIVQGVGVAIALCGAWYLSRWLSKQEAKT